MLLSLPSCLYFLPVYKAWKWPESLVKPRWNWYHALSRRFFLARNYLQRGRYKNSLPSCLYFLPVYKTHLAGVFFSPETISKRDDIKIKKISLLSVFFSFLYPFMLLSLPSCLYFLPVYKAWKWPESLVKPRWNWYHVLRRRFFSQVKFSPETISKGDDIKIKKNSQSFFPFLYPFILLSLPSCLYFLPVYKAWKWPESLVKPRWTWYHALSRRFFLARNYLQTGRYKN